MALELKKYRNSTELANLNGFPIYMSDMMDAALRGRLNTLLLGDTGSGKSQLAKDLMDYFPEKSLFILGRNDMDTRELFQRVNPEFLRALKEGNLNSNTKLKELTDKINYNLIVNDELPNCVPSVRAQLFNLFDGFIEIDGKLYSIGDGYSIGVATGNMGQQFTESSNDLGRALKDRMHLILDTDHFRPQPIDTFDILNNDRNPRVNFTESLEDRSLDIIQKHNELKEREVPFDKHIIAAYLVHALDYVEGFGSKIGMKSSWPNQLDGHASGSDEALILPVSLRAAKSIITLSQALDQITEEEGAKDLDYFNSMMTAFKFVSAYSGILNEALVRSVHSGNHYRAMDAVIETARREFDSKNEAIAAGYEMVNEGKMSEKVMNKFSGRWGYMQNLLENFNKRNETSK